MPPTPVEGSRVRSTLLWWSGVAAILLAWQIAALYQPAYVLPGPLPTLRALGELWDEGAITAGLALTLERAALGLLGACAIGLPWGWASGTWSAVREATDFWLQMLMALPPIVIVVVGMVWLGPKPEVVLLVVTLVSLPLLTTATRDAIARVDTDLLDMTRVFAFTPAMVVRHLIFPAVAGPVLSALTVAVGQSIRLTVMAELLSTTTGLGAGVQLARANLDTDDVFAYTLLMIVLTVCLELLVLAPLRRSVQRHLGG
ncbi:ABC transporter permease subunit [Dermabacteraceae bacterium TAE3-ERU27]|nr:ABC transporter permease subunit [Dermabacteraceae bacterium TAE3-ERU27]